MYINIHFDPDEALKIGLLRQQGVHSVHVVDEQKKTIGKYYLKDGTFHPNTIGKVVLRDGMKLLLVLPEVKS